MQWGGVTDNLPRIYSYDPFCIEYINGKNIYEYTNFSADQKKDLLKRIVICLKKIHGLEKVPAEEDSYRMAYLDKTFERLEKIRGLVPFANNRTVIVNGRLCRNVFYYRKELQGLIMKYMPQQFALIHGDCTFSNMLLRDDEVPVLIDPRGYFGKTELYGDVAYDWAKLYYSLFSNYDQFNLKRFDLDIRESNVNITIASNNWECMEDEFFSLLEGEVTERQMKLFLAVIWLSLTTYAWEDYDSICGAFYNGLYYFEEALDDSYDEGSAWKYFENNHKIMEDALRSVRKKDMDRLISACENVLKTGGRIIVTGLGKNVPICDKFVGTLLSLGLNAGFLHTNSAVHGDMGMVRSGDLVIMLTKSGSTKESVYLAGLLKKRDGVQLWLLSFSNRSPLTDIIENQLIVSLDHEGDQWDVIPNNSTTLNLIILQTIAIELSRRLDLELEKDFKPNHPGGAIGEHLENGN